MTIHSIPPQSIAPTPATGPAGRLRAGDPATAASGGAASVALTERALVLSRLAAGIEPTPAGLRGLASRLGDELARQLQRDGVDGGGAVAFDVDANAGTVRIQGGRPDAAAIDALLAGQPETILRIRDVAVLQQQVARMEAGSGPEAARRAAQDAAEASRLIARFAPAAAQGEDGATYATIARHAPAAAARLARAAAVYAQVAGEIDTARLATDGRREATGAGGSANSGRRG